MLIGFSGIAIIIFLLSLPLPSHISVSKSVLVNQPVAIVWQSLTNLEDWKNWNPLLQDSTTSYKFDSTNRVTWIAKDGKTNDVRLQPYAQDSLYAIIQTDGQEAFKSGFTVAANQDGGSHTKVEWWIQENLGWYPWQKFYGLFSESLKESYLENSLFSFKRHMEK